MKKILYIAVAMFGFTALASCTVDDGGTNGDSMPAITIIPRDLPAGFDQDGTLNATIIGNDKTATAYVYAERLDAKEEYIKANGEKAYIDKIMAEGELIIFDELGTKYALKETTRLFEDMFAVYAVTFVPVDVNGKVGKINNYVFNGVNWIKFADADAVGNPGWSEGFGIGPGGHHDIYCSETDPTHIKIEDIGPASVNWVFYYHEDGSITKGRTHYAGTATFDISMGVDVGATSGDTFNAYARISANKTDTFVTFDETDPSKLATMQIKANIAAYSNGAFAGNFTDSDAVFNLTFTYVE